MKRILLLSLALACIALPALADRDMTGCTVELMSPLSANPGETVTFTFWVCNNSPDNEWTSNVIFTFPECISALDGWVDGGAVTPSFDVVIDPGNVIAFMDGNGGWGEIYTDYCYTFFVSASLSTDCESGVAEILWEQQGDGYGAEPHTITGTLPFTIGVTPTDGSTWSAVKSLY